MRTFLISLSGIFLLSSCTSYTGTILNSTQLSQNNFIYLGNVEGTAEADYLFGIGGGDANGLVNEAKQDLYSKHPLQPGQAYANMSLDIAVSYWIVGATKKATINADIVQFLETGYNKPDTAVIKQANLTPASQRITNEIPGDKPNIFPYKIDDQVTFINSTKTESTGKIILLSFKESIATIETARDSANMSTKEAVNFSDITGFAPKTK